MMSPEYFQTFARYNTWANGLLYDATAELPDSAYRVPRPAAYFSSLHGTLNHILVGDRVWLSRFEAVDLGIARLDQNLFDDFAELRAAREAEDARIERYTAGLSAEAIAGDLRFRTLVKPKDPLTYLARLMTPAAAARRHLPAMRALVEEIVEGL